MTSMLAMKTCRCRVNPMPSSPQIENPEWSATRKVSRIQSAWNCLKDVEVAWYRNHAVQSEVGTVEQITIFLHRTNLAAGQDEHCNIRKFPSGMNISFRQREIHYQQNAIFRNCLSAIREDGMGLLVVPVHNHVFHQICPAAGGHLAEESAVHHHAAGF